jgi:aspartyl-tRNA synthetase
VALSRKHIDALTAEARSAGLGGLAVLKRSGDALSGPLAKLEGMSLESAGLEDGGLLLVCAGGDDVTSAGLDRVRRGVIERLALPPETEHALLGVHEVPLFERDEDTGQWVFAHHPFTAPNPADRDELMAGRYEGIRAQHYDLVYNGNELGSGSIRITDPAVQSRVFELLGFDAPQIEQRFGFLLRALAMGAPPHGGFAVGFDRVAMLLAGVASLRDVIVFPKTTAARALFEGAPALVPPSELDGLGIEVKGS